MCKNLFKVIYTLRLSFQKAVFEKRAKQVHHSIDELLDIPLGSIGDSISYERKMDNSEQIFEAKLRKVENARKKDRRNAQKLSAEVERLEKENAELRNKFNELQLDTITEVL